MTVRIRINSGRLRAAEQRMWRAEGREIAEEIQSDAERRANNVEVGVKTGELLASHYIEQNGDRFIVGNRARHAKFVHDGTIHMEARPWLRRAAEAVNGRRAR